MSMLPRVVERPDIDTDITRARIHFGDAFCVEVMRFKSMVAGEDDHWFDAEGNRFLLDGTPLVGAVDVPRLPQLPRVDGFCGVERRYIGGALKPLPYVRRLNVARLAVMAEEVAAPWPPAVRIYAGALAWEGARQALAQGGDAAALVVLPPGDDPLSYDWGPVGLWRYARGAVARIRDSGYWRPGQWTPRAGTGYWAVIEDRRSPVDEETTDQLAALCLAAGCSRVSAIGMHPFDAPYQDGPRRMVWTGPYDWSADPDVKRWVLQDYRLEIVQDVAA